MTASIDIVGIGNAIVDVLGETDDAFLARNGLARGTMTLVDSARAASLTEALAAGAPAGVVHRSGGSVANSCVVASLLGARVAYLGTVATDALGDAYRLDLEATGVAFPSRALEGDHPASGRCLIAITPDGQRTMSTFLGAANSFGPADLDHAVIASAAVLYLEGYLFDPPAAQEAFREAARIARGAGRQVAISLSDPFCVGRHRDAFAAFAREHADIVFANEAEIEALTGLSFAAAVDALAGDVGIVVATRGADGSMIASGGRRHRIAAAQAVVRDTTGAGDAYAAGFLAALVKGRGLEDAGRLAAAAAARVIEQIGARPDASSDAFRALRL